MRTLTTAQAAVLATGNYRVDIRVQVKDSDSAWRNLSNLEGYDWVESIEYGEELDQPVMSAKVYLWRNEYCLNLSPAVESSKLNKNAAGAYAALLDLNREIKIETATIAVEAEPAAGDWENVFEGRIDIIDWGGDEALVILECRDKGGVLQDTYIEEEVYYGEDLSETVMQAILTDNISGVTLYTPVASAWAIPEHTHPKEPLMDMLTNFAVQRGWVVRYKWDELTTAWRLTYYGPDRDKAIPDYEITPDMYLDVKRLDMDISGIRNAVRVVYTDAATGDHDSVTVTDSTSITRFGRRFMEITEDASSQIDTNAEATTMATACLKDLKDPVAEQEIEMHYFYPVEIGDLYRFTPNGVHYDTNQVLAVVGVRHKLSRDSQRTYLTVRGRPSGAYLGWIHRAAWPGVAPASHIPAIPTGLNLSTGIEESGQITVSYIKATWNKNTELNIRQYDIRYRMNDPTRGIGEWNYTSTSGLEQKTTVFGNIRYGFQARAVNVKGNFSDWTSEGLQTSAADTTPPATPTGLAVASAMRGLIITLNPNTELDWDGFEIHVSTQSGFTPGSGTLKAKGRNTRFEVAGLEPYVVYYVKAIAYDTSGNKSSATSQVAGTAHGETISSTLVVAASNASNKSNAGADYRCDQTGDETEINTAIQFLAGLGGGKLVLTEGTFVISNPIRLISNMVLEGQGKGTIIKLKNGFNADINMVSGNGVSNVIIRNLVIDGNRAQQTSGVQKGIYFTDSNHIIVENVIVRNCRGDGIRLESSSDNTVTGNTCQGSYYHGIRLYSSSNNNTVTGNTCQGNGWHGIRLESSSDNTVTGNTCQGSYNHGIALYSSSNNNTVTGNTCQGNGWHGIHLYLSSNNNTVTGNTCQGNGWHGIRLESSSDNTVTGNTCQGSYYHGIALYSSSNNNTVTGNTCQGNGQAANDTYDNIHITDNSDYNNIQSNTCRKGTAANKPRYGIRIHTANCDGNIVTNNDLYDSGVSGSFSDLGTGTITTAGNRL